MCVREGGGRGYYGYTYSCPPSYCIWVISINRPLPRQIIHINPLIPGSRSTEELASALYQWGEKTLVHWKWVGFTPFDEVDTGYKGAVRFNSLRELRDGLFVVFLVDDLVGVGDNEQGEKKKKKKRGSGSA